MKILSFTATGALVPYSLLDVQAALLRLGHEVLVLDIAGIAAYQDKLVAIADALVSAEPDMIFTIDRIGLFPAALCLLKKPERVVAWFFDDPLASINEEFLLINSRLHFFLWDRAYLPLLREKGYAHLDYCPFASNPDVFKPTPAPRGGYDFDVSFVGRSSERRMATVSFLAENGVRVDVFGDRHWAALKNKNVVFHGEASNRNDCPKIFSNSKINLNITSEQLITSAPLRVFDALACGGFLLTDWREDIGRLFRDNEELVIYEDQTDLLAKTRKHLALPDERRRVGENGRQRVLAEYTFDKTIPKILETALSAGSDDRVNAVLTGLPLARAKWLLALSFVKFGLYGNACELFMDLLRENPDDPDAILGMAVLACRLGRAEAVRASVEKLESLRSQHAELGPELEECARGNGQINCWDRLYRIVFPDASLSLNPDGTVQGCRPAAPGR